MLNLKSACGYFMDFFMVGFQTNAPEGHAVPAPLVAPLSKCKQNTGNLTNCSIFNMSVYSFNVN
jgi:hypothetical protein